MITIQMVQKMIKIDAKEHNQLVEAYDKYKEYYDLYGKISISEQHDEMIRQKASELLGTYDYYKILILELERCIGNYHSIKHTLRSKIGSPARKINAIKRNKK